MGTSRLLLTVLLAVMLAAACIPGWAFDPTVPAAQRNAILFSWDGAQREHVMECLSRNELPNLAALIAEGKLVDIEVTNHKSDTKAGHTQMLTGYDPDLTGVYSNSKFRAIPAGLSIFERLEQAFGKDKIATVMLTGKTHHVGACAPSTPEQIAQAKKELEELGPETGRIVQDPDAEKERQKAVRKQNAKPAKKKKAGNAVRERLKATMFNTAGEPWHIVSKNMDVWDGERSRDHTQVGPLMLGYLNKYAKSRFFAFFHFSDPDHKGHNFGENSKEYTDAIVDCDKELGAAVKKLKDLGIYDKTMVFVTADHGFDEGKTSHGNAPRVVLVGNMKTLTKNGDQRDIVPTILKEMGVDISKAQPRYKGILLTSD